MELLDFDQLSAEAEAFDQHVAASPLVDRYCSGSAWILPAREVFHPEATSLVLKGEHGWAPLMVQSQVGLRIGMPLEATWCLASPFVGLDLAALAREAWAELARRRTAWHVLFLAGLEPGGAAIETLASLAAARHEVGIGPSSVRCVADLAEGMDAWLARRSARFRRSLTHLRNRAASEIEYEDRDGVAPGEVDELYARILAVERTSWKGREGSGISSPTMQAFYARTLPRLAARGALRATFARRAGRDVGFVFGGVLAGGYRGLQFSYDRDAAAYGVGNLLQWRTMTRLCAEGVLVYDLGMDMDYKQRWADRRVETTSLVIRRR